MRLAENASTFFVLLRKFILEPAAFVSRLIFGGCTSKTGESMLESKK
jgi:hypothetical protein